MTESLRPDDEAVSSLLDGEATPEEAERVAGSPELSARLDEFRSVAGLVGAPVTVPGEDLDRIRSAAVARAMADNERTAADDEQGAVVDLAAAAERRRGRLRAGARVVSAAAALVAAAGLGYGLAGIGDSDDGFEDIALEAALDAADETAGDVDDSASFDDEESTDVADMAADLADSDDAAQDDAAEGAVAQDDAGTDGTSSGDSAQDEPASGDSGVQAAVPPAQALGSGFDPLPDRLDPVSNLEALTTALQDRLDEYSAEPYGAALQSECEALLVDTALAGGAVAADSARVLVDGASYAVVVARHGDPAAIEVLAAPEPACEPVSPLQPALP